MEREIQVRHVSLDVDADFESLLQPWNGLSADSIIRFTKI